MTRRINLGQVTYIQVREDQTGHNKEHATTTVLLLQLGSAEHSPLRPCYQQRVLQGLDSLFPIEKSERWSAQVTWYRVVRTYAAQLI